MRIIYYLLALIPSLVFAQDTGLEFVPVDTDLSLRYLGKIFGYVDGVLYGTGTQILGDMFRIFNAAALALGGIIVAYILLRSTVETAHEGELLGKKWSTLFVPLRAAIGFGLLVPKASGYSVIQVFVMWVVIQGIGAGNSVWNAALNYLDTKGAVIEASKQMSQVIDIDKVTEFSTALARASICMEAVQEVYREDNKLSYLPSFTTSVLQVANSESKLPLPDKIRDHDIFQKICGYVGGVGGVGTDERARVGIAHSIAVKQMLVTVAPLSRIVVNNWMNNDRNLLKTWSDRFFLPTRDNYLLPAILNYQEIMARELTRERGGGAKGFIDGAKQRGWLSAGMYYFDIVKVTGGSLKSDTVPSMNDYPVPLSETTEVSITQKHTFENKLIDIGIKEESARQLYHLLYVVNTDVYNPIYTNYLRVRMLDFTADIGAYTGWKSIGTSLGGIWSVLNPVGDALRSFDKLRNLKGTMMNPLLILTKIGNSMINAAAQMWVITGFLIAGIAAFAGTKAMALAAFIVPIVMILLTVLVSTGAILAYYIPLLPFLLFIFVGFGWFFAVVEAIVAAPIVALGIAHPEGHETFGKADPAILIIINVFLRPSLMVIGFIIGIMLTYFFMWMTLEGIMYVWIQVTKRLSGLASLFSGLFILVILATISMEVINKAFTLVHLLPDRIMRWIGGGIEHYGAEAAASLGSVKGAIGGAGRIIGQGMGGVLKGGMGAAGKSGKGGAGAKVTSGGKKGGAGFKGK